MLDRRDEAVSQALDSRQCRAMALGKGRLYKVLSEWEAGSGAHPDSRGVADTRTQVLEVRAEICGAGNRDRKMHSGKWGVDEITTQDIGCGLGHK